MSKSNGRRERGGAANHPGVALKNDCGVDSNQLPRDVLVAARKHMTLVALA
jgi:hypothetical protein